MEVFPRRPHAHHPTVLVAVGTPPQSNLTVFTGIDVTIASQDPVANLPGHIAEILEYRYYPVRDSIRSGSESHSLNRFPE